MNRQSHEKVWETFLMPRGITLAESGVFSSRGFGSAELIHLSIQPHPNGTGHSVRTSNPSNTNARGVCFCLQKNLNLTSNPDHPCLLVVIHLTPEIQRTICISMNKDKLPSRRQLHPDGARLIFRNQHLLITHVHGFFSSMVTTTDPSLSLYILKNKSIKY